MAYTYDDWVTYDSGVAKVARLRLHMQEVSQKIDREVGADGKNVSSNATMAYYKELKASLAEEQRRPGANPSIGGGVSRADFRSREG